MSKKHKVIMLSRDGVLKTCCSYVEVNCFLIHNNKPTKYTKLFLRYLYFNIALNIATCFDPQRTNIRESNQSTAAHKQISNFFTQLTRCRRVKQLKCRQFFVEYLYTCAGT